MARLGSEFFTNQATMRMLVLASGFWLALLGPALAIECEDDAPTLVLRPPVTNPSPADRNAIVDLFHGYGWALDDKDPEGFEALFTDDAVYEVCNGGAANQILRVTSKAELRMRIESQFAELGLLLQTRHFVTNTILDVSDEKQPDIVDGKTMLLVTIQRGDEIAGPGLDYTATLRALIVKDGDVWKFKKLTLFTDLPLIITKAR